MQNWARLGGQWSGRPADLAVTAAPGAPPGSAADSTLRRSITGPSRVAFEPAFRRLYDEIIATGGLEQGA